MHGIANSLTVDFVHVLHQQILNYLPTFTPAGEFPGLVVVVLPKLSFVFLSAGFNIWKEHISVSSTLIIAPALSNSPQ